MNDNNYEFEVEQIADIRNEFLEGGNRYDFAKANFLLVEKLIEEDKIEEAFNQIENDDLKKICENNKIIHAEYNYYLSEIAVNNDTELELKTPFDYLTKAYDLISEQTITEITRKIVFALAQLYFERGNFAKAKEFSLYTKGIILFFEEKIKNDDLKKYYISKQERKNALEKTKLFENQE